MTDDFTLDPARTYNPKKPVVAQPAAKTESPLDLAAIDAMGIEELRKALKLVVQAGWGIKGISGAELLKNAQRADNELYEALMLKGITLALNASEWREFHALASFWSERKKGKPQQSVDITGKIGIVDIVLEAARRRNNGGTIGGTLPPLVIDNDDKIV